MDMLPAKAHHSGELEPPPPDNKLSGPPLYGTPTSFPQRDTLWGQIVESIQECLLIAQIWATLGILLGNYALDLLLSQIYAQSPDNRLKRTARAPNSPHTTINRPPSELSPLSHPSAIAMTTDQFTTAQDPSSSEYQVLNQSRAHEYGPRDLHAFDGSTANWWTCGHQLGTTCLMHVANSWIPAARQLAAS
jgi:hypothetical protein